MNRGLKIVLLKELSQHYHLKFKKNVLRRDLKEHVAQKNRSRLGGEIESIQS